MTLRISIAMCTYNGSRFLEEQLDTIAAQARQPDEMVVCDDGSSDGTVQMIEAFSLRVSFPVHLVINEKQLGSTKNFEKAIGLTRGDIVALADQDDAWYPHKLARIGKEFASAPEVIALFSDADLMDSNSVASSGRSLWKSFSFSGTEQKRFTQGHAVEVLTKHPVVTGATMAFLKRFFRFLTPIPYDDVHDRWLSFLLAACGPFAVVPQALMRYRQHPDQQIGVGANNFGDRLARAQQTGTDVYLAEIKRFRQLYSHLTRYRENLSYAELAMEEIARKIAHLEHRISVRDNKGGRFARIFGEIRNHGYWNYSAGWESVAKDLFLYGHSSR